MMFTTRDRDNDRKNNCICAFKLAGGIGIVHTSALLVTMKVMSLQLKQGSLCCSMFIDTTCTTSVTSASKAVKSVAMIIRTRAQ